MFTLTEHYIVTIFYFYTRMLHLREKIEDKKLGVATCF